LAKYPIEDSGKIGCYAVPLDDLAEYQVQKEAK
jgi:hypothetical protein